MMNQNDRLETILSLLKNAGADGWEVTDTVTEGWEFYLIRHALDQNRARLTEHICVKLYKLSDEGKMGSAEGEIPPTATEEEARTLIQRYLSQASYVKNPPYSLTPPETSQPQAPSELPDPAAIARDFLTVLSSLEETEDTLLNSAEIFVDAVTRRFVNSRGVDVVSVYPSSMLEAVINARHGGHEIELYRMFRSGTCDAAELKHGLEEAFQFGRDRLHTVPTPKLRTCDLVLSTSDALEVYSFFVNRMNASSIYQGISDWTVGTDVMKDALGDRITLQCVQDLPNSSRNALYDPEGAKVRDMTIIKDGIAQHIFGRRQFCEYLKVSDGFLPQNFTVSGGTSDDLYQGTCLEVVEFSDFQVNAMTGDLAGEIRLGYLYQNGKKTIVSGGSVSGNMLALCKNMHMSKAQRQYDFARIPAVTRLQGVSVAGIAEMD